MLLFLVNGQVSYRRRGGGRAACITQRGPKRNHFTEVMLAAVPRALVERFFLTPDKIMHVRIRFQRFLYRLVRERVELLYANDSDIFCSFLRRCSSRS